MRARRAHESLQTALGAYRSAEEEGQLSRVLEGSADDPEHPSLKGQEGAVQPVSPPDFPSLYAMREVMRPKIWLPFRCPVAAAENADAASKEEQEDGEGEEGSRQEERQLSCTCPSRPNRASDGSGCSGRRNTGGEAPCNLFGTVVANPFCGHVTASVLDQGTRVVLPPRSAFLMSEGVGTLGPLVACAAVEKFRFIVADPPWCAARAFGPPPRPPLFLPSSLPPPATYIDSLRQTTRATLLPLSICPAHRENASVKRSRQYSMLPSRELLKLPLPQLIDPETGLLALWVTNR